MKIVPGILKLPDQDVEIVKIGTEIITHPANTNLYKIWVADGRINTMASRWKKSNLKERNIPKSHLVTISGNLADNVEPKAICCVAHLCHRELTKEIEKFDERIFEAEKKRDEWYEKVLELQNVINESVQQLAKLGGTEAERIISSMQESLKTMPMPKLRSEKK